MPPTLEQLRFDLPDAPIPAPEWIEELLKRHPDLDIPRCPIPAYDARLRTSTCLACGNRIAECPGWKGQQS